MSASLGTVLVYTCCPGVVNRTHFHLQKCPGLDNKLYAPPTICEAPKPLDPWSILMPEWMFHIFSRCGTTQGILPHSAPEDLGPTSLIIVPPLRRFGKGESISSDAFPACSHFYPLVALPWSLTSTPCQRFLLNMELIFPT